MRMQANTHDLLNIHNQVSTYRALPSSHVNGIYYQEHFPILSAFIVKIAPVNQLVQPPVLQFITPVHNVLLKANDNNMAHCSRRENPKTVSSSSCLPEKTKPPIPIKPKSVTSIQFKDSKGCNQETSSHRQPDANATQEVQETSANLHQQTEKPNSPTKRPPSRERLESGFNKQSSEANCSKSPKSTEQKDTVTQESTVNNRGTKGEKEINSVCIVEWSLNRLKNLIEKMEKEQQKNSDKEDAGKEILKLYWKGRACHFYDAVKTSIYENVTAEAHSYCRKKEDPVILRQIQMNEGDKMSTNIYTKLNSTTLDKLTTNALDPMDKVGSSSWYFETFRNSPNEVRPKASKIPEPTAQSKLRSSNWSMENFSSTHVPFLETIDCSVLNTSEMTARPKGKSGHDASQTLVLSESGQNDFTCSLKPNTVPLIQTFASTEKQTETNEKTKVDLTVALCEADPEPSKAVPEVDLTVTLCEADPKPSKTVPEDDLTVALCEADPKPSKTVPEDDLTVALCEADPKPSKTVPEDDLTVTLCEVDPEPRKIVPEVGLTVALCDPEPSKTDPEVGLTVTLCEVDPEPSKTVPQNDQMDISLSTPSEITKRCNDEEKMGDNERAFPVNDHHEFNETDVSDNLSGKNGDSSRPTLIDHNQLATENSNQIKDKDLSLDRNASKQSSPTQQNCANIPSVSPLSLQPASKSDYVRCQSELSPVVTTTEHTQPDAADPLKAMKQMVRMMEKRDVKKRYKKSKPTLLAPFNTVKEHVRNEIITETIWYDAQTTPTLTNEPIPQTDSPRSLSSNATVTNHAASLPCLESSIRYGHNSPATEEPNDPLISVDGSAEKESVITKCANTVFLPKRQEESIQPRDLVSCERNNLGEDPTLRINLTREEEIQLLPQNIAKQWFACETKDKDTEKKPPSEDQNERLVPEVKTATKTMMNVQRVNVKNLPHYCCLEKWMQILCLCFVANSVCKCNDTEKQVQKPEDHHGGVISDTSTRETTVSENPQVSNDANIDQKRLSPGILKEILVSEPVGNKSPLKCSSSERTDHSEAEQTISLALYGSSCDQGSNKFGTVWGGEKPSAILKLSSPCDPHQLGIKKRKHIFDCESPKLSSVPPHDKVEHKVTEKHAPLTSTNEKRLDGNSKNNESRTESMQSRRTLTKKPTRKRRHTSSQMSMNKFISRGKTISSKSSFLLPHTEMKSKFELGNPAMMPLVGGETLEFKVLPPSFNFKDGTEINKCANSLTKADEGEKVKKSSPETKKAKSLKTSRSSTQGVAGDWFSHPQSVRTTDVSSSYNLFQEFRKKYKEKKESAQCKYVS